MPVDRMPAPSCDDCGTPYGGKDWLDTVLPRDQWERISAGSSILCANCIVVRARQAYPASEGRGAIRIDARIVLAEELE